ncbi:hypothetical protein St703_05680 [Sporolactobacillus terrae]|uniref:Uncharacterized protein n=1 Tax=Sporolactobacillus terrae TaxID=269673 RepID=A0A5K7WZV3_9BACL|nr:hypothetical protein St703_05680 [Sporolactobacillus terrae]
MVNRLVIYWYIPCQCVVKNMALVVHIIGRNQRKEKELCLCYDYSSENEREREESSLF